MSMCHVVCGDPDEHGQYLGERIDSQPQPEHLSGAAQPGSQFIQLDMRELEIGEEAPVQGLCMLPSASQPGGDGGLTIAEDPRSSEGSSPSASAASTMAIW